MARSPSSRSRRCGVKDSYRALGTGRLDISRIRVRVRRLDTILAAHAPELERVEIVSIDVEGWELEVLRGFSLERFQPTVLIVENVFEDAGYRGRWRSAVTTVASRRPNDVYTRRAIDQEPAAVDERRALP